MKLELLGLNVAYRTKNGELHAVKDCTFAVPKGQVVGLVGESGSGKTSALMAIPALLPSGTRVSGKILCGDEDLLTLDEDQINARRWRRFALVPQGASASFTPHISIGKHITEVLGVHLGMNFRAARARAVDLLRTADLDGAYFDRFPHELSGGQRQRAALAAALACDPDFLLCDEPTTALDVVTQKEVLDTIISRVRERGMGLLLVTHDLPLAAQSCDVLVVMKDGEVVESGEARKVALTPLHPYTRRLVEALRYVERGGAA